MHLDGRIARAAEKDRALLGGRTVETVITTDNGGASSALNSSQLLLR